MGVVMGRMKRRPTVMVLGLDNCGKTTIVNSLMNTTDRGVDTLVPNPSVGVSVQKIQANSMEMDVHDVSGKLRAAWEKLYKKCDGIIFVLDSSDPLRLAVAREELALTLTHEDLESKPVPILFLANKMDVDEAIDCKACSEALGLSDIGDRHWKIFPSNGLTGEGLGDAIDWFTDELKNCSKRTT